MSLKQEIETWVQALAHYDNNEFEESLKIFDNIADTSKILFNCGVIHATLGEHEKAVECYQQAIQLDQYLAIAYFQQGVSNFLVGDFEEALVNFNDTLLYLRGNTYIDYDQLGLKFRLYSCEVLFNRGLCYIYLQQEQAGMQDFEYAVKEKMTPDHDVIDDAIREKAAGYTVFSIPVGLVYRPNPAKVKNLKTKDYLGKARLVAASDRSNAFTGFQGTERKQAVALDLTPKDDRPIENISFAATNLVQKGLTGRGGREQSAPPAMNRNMFPPTPPPDSDKIVNNNGSGGLTGRAASVRNPPGKSTFQPRQNSDMPISEPRPAMLSRTNTMPTGMTPTRNQMSPTPQLESLRLGTSRTSSEPRAQALKRQYSDRGPRQNKPPLFRETTPQQHFQSVQEDTACEDVYDLYRSPEPAREPRRAGSRRMMQPTRYMGEEEEGMSDLYEEEAFVGDDGVDFEMLRGNGSYQPTQARRPSESQWSDSRDSDIRKIRVKVHAKDDTRYIMIGPTVEYGDFESKIREKFGIKSKLRIRMQDEGDMITMSDQDDLDMLMGNAKVAAKQEKNEMGKMEVWIQEIQ